MLRRLFLLAMIIGIGSFLILEDSTKVKAASCYDCSNNLGICVGAALIDYETCTALGGSNCESNYSNALNQCSQTSVSCFDSCTGPGGGSGGGGGRTKTPAQQACYAARSACEGGDYGEGIQACIDDGGALFSCCLAEFDDCMANAG